MSCADFERTVERVLAGEVSASERPKALERLKRHAAECDSCRGTKDLVSWLELPAGERNLVADPGADYWEDFNRRVHERVEREPVAGGRPLDGRRWAAVAAVLAAVGLGAWLVWPPPTNVGTVVEIRPAADATSAPPAIPQALVELIDRASAPGAEEPVAGVEGWTSGPEDGSWLFPETEDLEPEDRRELLEWLRERTKPSSEVPS